MEFKYKMTRDNLKKLYIKENSRYDFFVMIIASTYYIIFSICFSFLSFGWFYLSYMMFLAISFLIVTGLNRLYINYILQLNDKVTNNAYGEFIITIDDEKINERINDNEYTMSWSNIKKVIYKDDLIILYPDSKKGKLKTICFIYYRDFFVNKKDFEKLKSIIDDKITNKK